MEPIATAVALRVLEGPLLEQPLRVLGVSGEEAVSELFSFVVAVVATAGVGEHAPSPAALERGLLGRRVALSLAYGSSTVGAAAAVTRERYGIIAAVHGAATVDADGVHGVRCDCEVVPRAWRLHLRRRSRIFQDMFLHQIVSRVLFEHGLLHVWWLKKHYQKKVYCTQFNETDYEFVTRLLAQDGVAFFFRHVPPAGGDETHVAQAALGGPLPEVRSARTSWNDAVATGIGVSATLSAGGGELADSGSLEMMGGVAGLASDLFRGPAGDPEAGMEVQGLFGSAGSEDDYGDVFCFVDEAGGYQGRDEMTRVGEPEPSLRLCAESTLLGTGDEVFRWSAARRLAPEAVEQRDHDYTRPLLVLRSYVRSAAQSYGAPEAERDGAAREVTDRPHGHGVPDALGVFDSARLEVYEHHGEHERPDISRENAGVRLEQYQADGRTATAQANDPRLCPGHTFRLDGEALPRAREGRYAVVRVSHSWFEPAHPSAAALGWDGLASRVARSTSAGDGAGSRVAVALERARSRGLDGRGATGNGYRNAFECVPAEALYRPAPPARAPHVVSELATVMGPRGEEIHTDALGRVRVQFYWDREGRWDETSSCWLRVVQPWAGAGYGFQFIPRVGMQVLVTFVGGDADRPVVSGCLYDGTHALPEAPVAHATRSAIRTQSSPGGTGFHEVVFEDAAGQERLAIRSHKVLEETAHGAHEVSVGADQRVTIAGSQEVAVGARQFVGVAARQVLQVGADQHEAVGGSASRTVGAHQSERVAGDALCAVSGLAVRVSERDEVSVVRGTRSVSVQGNALTHVGGAEHGGDALAFVEGSAYLNAVGKVVVRGLSSGSGDDASSITLAVGDSSLQITGSKITIQSQTVEIVGTSAVTAKGSSATLGLDGDGGALAGSPAKISNSDGAALSLEGGVAKLLGPSEAHVSGGAVKLAAAGGGAPASEAPGSSSNTPSDNVHLEFTHKHFVPSSPQAEGPTFTVDTLSNVDARIFMDGAVDTSRHTDDKGVLSFHAPDHVTEVQVELRVDTHATFKSLYPDGPLSFVVKLLATVPAASEPEGKRLRLRNLGYEAGARPVTSALDPLTERALERFIVDQRLESREQLTRDLQNRLNALYPTG